MIINLLKYLIRYLKSKYIFTFFYEQWYILYYLGGSNASDFSQYKKLVPPGDRFWADPHIIYEKDVYYIFLEEYMYSTRKGHISFMNMNQDGSWTEPIKVIDKPYHLSYPSVFKYEGTYYMIPESKQNKTIDIYRCVRFPDKWEFHKNMMSGIEAVDSTIFFHNGKYWLFSNNILNAGGNSYDELFLHYSDSLFSGRWTAHPANPIVSDIKRARPAGKIFEKNGKIYRPSQDCSRSYGYGLRLNEIVVINENEYKEIEVDTAFPEWDHDVRALHTLNHEEDLTVIDAINNRCKFSNNFV
jgi:hypothetical protein